MLLTPRLLSLTVALAVVFATPYVVGAQSKAAEQVARKIIEQASGAPAQAAGQPAPKPAGTPAPQPAASPAPKAPANQPAPAPTSGKPAAAPAAPSAPVTQPPTPLGPELEPQGYTYDPAGRRDPFVSLLRRGSDTQKATTGIRGPGLAGLETAEVVLKGTIASQGGYVGIVQGSDAKTYIVHAGDKLLDGTIRAITQDSMVITQQVTDPLSLEKQREVRKVLRQTEEAK